jgi:hypothetical protein
MWCVRARREINNGILQGKPVKGDRLEGVGVEGKIILNCNFKIKK